MLSFARSDVVKNKYEGLDVGPHEWIQWRAFIETISNFDYAFSFLFLLSFGFDFVSRFVPRGWQGGYVAHI